MEGLGGLSLVRTEPMALLPVGASWLAIVSGAPDASASKFASTESGDLVGIY